MQDRHVPTDDELMDVDIILTRLASITSHLTVMVEGWTSEGVPGREDPGVRGSAVRITVDRFRGEIERAANLVTEWRQQRPGHTPDPAGRPHHPHDNAVARALAEPIVDLHAPATYRDRWPGLILAIATVEGAEHTWNARDRRTGAILASGSGNTLSAVAALDLAQAITTGENISTPVVHEANRYGWLLRDGRVMAAPGSERPAGQPWSTR